MRTADFENGTYAVGKVVGVASARVESGRTTPPDRYTEATLLEDMTSAHKFASNDNDKSVLREISGLGTSRTRATVIAGLIERGMLAKQDMAAGRSGRKKTVIVSAPHARQIVKMLPASLTSVATTARWELAFRLVQEGQATPAQMKAHLDRALVEIVQDAKRRGAAADASVPQKPQQPVLQTSR